MRDEPALPGHVTWSTIKADQSPTGDVTIVFQAYFDAGALPQLEESGEIFAGNLKKHVEGRFPPFGIGDVSVKFVPGRWASDDTLSAGTITIRGTRGLLNQSIGDLIVSNFTSLVLARQTESSRRRSELRRACAEFTAAVKRAAGLGSLEEAA